MPPFSIINPLVGGVIPEWGHFKSLYEYDDGSKYEHPGVDTMFLDSRPTLGAVLVAPGDGRVGVHRPGDGWGDGSFGVCVVIDHLGTEFYSICAHMAHELLVEEGQLVKQGQPIGRVGLTGKTSGPHCHLGLSNNDSGFAPLRQWRGGIHVITNDRLLDPEMYFAKKVALTTEERLARAERIIARAVDTDGDGHADLTDEQALEWIDSQGISLALTATRQNLAMRGELT